MKKCFAALLAIVAALCLLAACEAAQTDPTPPPSTTQAHTTAPAGVEQPQPSASQTTKPDCLPDDWFVTPSQPTFTAPDEPPPDFTIPPQPEPDVDEPAYS